MIAFRRPRYNFGLQRAVNLAKELDKPLLIFEPLRCGYRWASDRLHAFVIQGMTDNHTAFSDLPVTYFPYLEAKRGQGSGLLEKLGQQAAVVVTDDYPAFFLPRMLSKAAKILNVPLELVDSNGIYPLYDTDRVFTVAHSFRRHLQKTIRPFLDDFPTANPLQNVKLPELGSLPTEITDRWPVADLSVLQGDGLAEIELDHSVPAVEDRPGGFQEAGKRLRTFVESRLDHYEERNNPDAEAASELSPWLHFGHISAHEIFSAVMRADDWNPGKIAKKPNGKTHGWWNASDAVEGFLDEFITWREIGFNMSAHTDNYEEFDSLPDWVKTTLDEHRSDEREHVYSLEEFESASTHDELWNAAQRQLVSEGIIHNYLRMLWGKKVLEWTEKPEDALEILIHLNNKYALDGRDPNSYSGIFWVLGRYDRAWQERPIYGKVRTMSSQNTQRKVDLKKYLEKWG
jgi:deoxyribodipyrimidine photo-lyase